MHYLHFLEPLLHELDNHIGHCRAVVSLVAPDTARPAEQDSQTRARLRSDIFQRATDDDAELYDCDSGLHERLIQDRLSEPEQLIRLQADAAVLNLALVFEFARCSRIDLPFSPALPTAWRQRLDHLLADSFSDRAVGHDRPVPGLYDDAFKALLCAVCSVCSLGTGLAIEVAHRLGRGLTERQASWARQADWRHRRVLRSYLVKSPGTWLWLGQQVAESAAEASSHVVARQALRTLLDDLIGLFERSGAANYDLATQSVERFQRHAEAQRDRLLVLDAAIEGGSHRGRTRFADLDLVEVELGTPIHPHAARLMRRQLGKSYARRRLATRPLETVLKYLSGELRTNFALAIDVAGLAGVHLPYDKRMVDAWTYVHLRLLRGAFGQRGAGSGDESDLDAGWLKRLLTKLIEATLFNLRTTLHVAGLAGAELAFNAHELAEREAQLLALLEQAVPAAGAASVRPLPGTRPRRPVGLGATNLLAALREASAALRSAASGLVRYAHRRALVRGEQTVFGELLDHPASAQIVVERSPGGQGAGSQDEQESSGPERSIDHARLRTFLDELIRALGLDAAFASAVRKAACGGRDKQDGPGPPARSLRRLLRGAYPLHRGRRLNPMRFERLLSGLADTAARNLTLAIEGAEALGVALAQERDMAAARACTHQQLVQRTFRGAPGTSGDPDSQLDARTLQVLLAMLVEASSFAAALAFEMAPQAGVAPPATTPRERNAALATLLDEALPPAA